MDSDSATSTIEHVYAELLLNVRIITIFVRIKAGLAAEVDLKVERDGVTAVVSCQSHRAVIRLPAKVDVGQSSMTALPTVTAGETSIRLPLDPEQQLPEDDNTSNNVWSATDLLSFECGHCRTCNRNIVLPDTITEWKDLPSEGWAEMMDFWHCHKPDEPLDNSQHEVVNQKGYSASSRLVARVGVGFVDVSHFVLAPKDCRNIEVANNAEQYQNHDHHPPLKCIGCGAVLGFVDPHLEGWRLYQWALSIGIKNKVQLERLDLELCLSARLLSISEAGSVRRLRITPDIPSSPSLYIWIFTIDFWCTFWDVIASDMVLTRAMKILWKPVNPSRDAPHNHDLETLRLPAAVVDDLVEALSANAQQLPASTEKHQDWDISFLRRA